MNETSPPVFVEPATLPAPSGKFARLAATFSLLAPLGALLIFIFLFAYLPYHGSTHTLVIGMLSLLAFLLVLSGLVFGVIALAHVKKCGREGIFGKAVAGMCASGLFLVALAVLIIVPFIIVKKNHIPTTPQGRLASAVNTLNTATNEVDKFYALDHAAKESFVVGKIDDARKYATELLALAPKYARSWNYGNAIQDGNLVLGRIALQEGRIDEAKQYLLAAGKSAGSPQMNSFGPNMSLARDLLEKGERDIVVQYFELCRKFWKMDYGKLSQWSQEVKAGKVPDFGANLLY